MKPSSTGREDKSEEAKARASTLDFKKVNEVYVYASKIALSSPELILCSWDKKEYKYKVMESLTQPDKVN